MSARGFRSILRWAALAAVACALSAPAAAQARLTGKVLGPDGEPLKGAVIKMIPEDPGNTTVETESNKKGKFVFGLLRNDTYRLVAFHDGMRVAYIDAVLSKPDDDDFWSYDGEVPPGAEMPTFAVDGLSTVTYDLKFENYAGDLGEYGTGVPANPVDVIIGQLQAGKAEEALAEATKVAEKNPDNATAHYLLGFAQVSTGDAAGAEASARRVLEIDPSFDGGQTLLGRALEAQGKLEDAVAAYTAQIDTAGSQQVRQEAMLAAAVTYERLGDDVKAAAMLERLVEAGSEDVKVYLELADLYIRTGQPDKANAMMTKVTEMGLADPVVLYNLGAEKFNEGDFPAAEDLFRQAIAGNPDLADAYRQLAFTLLNQGDREGAAAALAMYLEKSPEETEATASARAIYEQLKQAP